MARAALERWRAHATGQLPAQRARVVLAAADGLNNTQIGVALGITAKMARQWRVRWLAQAALDGPGALALRKPLSVDYRLALVRRHLA